MKLDYIIKGTGDISLLFVHGAFIDKDYWQEQLEYFSKTYKVVLVDLAGHGRSDKNRDNWSIQSLGDDIISVIVESGLSNIILIGHSLGGDVILEVADKIPDLITGFIGIDNFKYAGTALPPSITKQIEQALIMMKSDFPSVSEAFARQSLLTDSTDDQIRNRIIKDYKNFDPETGVALLTSSFTYFNRERELLQRLRFKLHLINVDYVPTYEDLLKLYAHSGYLVMNIKGTCHYPMIENPSEFNHLLETAVLNILSSQKSAF